MIFRTPSKNGTLALWMAALVVSTQAFSHANLMVRRAGEDIKIQASSAGTPCGAAPAATVPAGNTFTAGTSVDIQMVETIHHPGHYFFALAKTAAPTKDVDLVPLTIVSATETDVANKVVALTVTKNAANKVIVVNGTPRAQDGINGDTLAQHNNVQVSTVKISVKLQIPADMPACAQCALQLVQQMEENPNSPTYYKSCSDVRINAANGATPTPTPNPTPTPTPNPKATPTPAPTTSAGCH